MKTRERKQEDLQALTEQLKNSNSAMVLSFNKLTVAKDQEFRNELRQAGADYRVVKNTLARIAVEGTPFEGAREHFKGVTSIATIDGEPIDLSKIISKYVKENKDVFEFKAGVVDGKVVDFNDVERIASLPSKEELIGKLLFLLNAPAQRLATVLNAVPRNLAVVLKQVSERTDNLPGESEAKADDASPAEKTEETAGAEDTAASGESQETEENSAESAPAAEAAEGDSGEDKTDDAAASESDAEEPKA